MKNTGILFWISGLLAVAVTSICIHIEILNHRDGGYLPVDFSDYPAGANRKWRCAISSESHIREMEMRMFRYESALPEDADIPPEAMASIQEKVETRAKAARNNNRLHDAVASVGLLQYLLYPIAIACAVALVVKKGNRFHVAAGGVFALVSLASCIMMFYRGYFTSLGW